LESLFRNGDLTVRELVRGVARSGLYRQRFFERCNPYRFIELNHKHLLGRAPQNREEMLHHFSILQGQGYDAEIDSYIDSPEYQERFGGDQVPFVHGWAYSTGHEGRQFSWLMQLARGAAASAKGDRSGNRAALNQWLHQNRAVPVAGAAPAINLGPIPVQRDDSRISTDGPFRALVSTDSTLPESGPDGPGRSHANGQRRLALGIGASGRGTAGGQGRLVTISASGIADNGYCQGGATTIRVPYSRMNEALRRIQRLGGRVEAIAVSGSDTMANGAVDRAVDMAMDRAVDPAAGSRTARSAGAGSKTEQPRSRSRRSRRQG
ncbi:MAG: phycobilisome rod-core linker polypeptide, partial [Synechococcaceae cyanobacterium]